MIRLGTRGSPLALAQADAVAARLRASGVGVELVPMRTEGDRLLGVPLASAGGKGLFVREIDEALMAGAIDVAVHSLKDLPAEIPQGLALAAFPEREDPRDVLVTRTGGDLEDLPAGSVVGTSSPRRRAIVLARRPDLLVEPIRGNVETRLRKLESGLCDAVIVAAAGLHRLGLRLPHACTLPTDVFVPAVGQGALGIEIREADRRLRDLVETLDHPPTRVCALTERAFLRRLGASCKSPMAAHATIVSSAASPAQTGPDGAPSLCLIALIASEDGHDILRGSLNGEIGDAETIGRTLAEELLERGAAAVAALQPEKRSANPG